VAAKDPAAVVRAIASLNALDAAETSPVMPFDDLKQIVLQGEGTRGCRAGG
jgi:hypothetical protein